MSLLSRRRLRRAAARSPLGRRVLALAAVCAFALAVLVPTASAYINSFGGRNLPGHTWSGGGVYGPGLFETLGEAETSSSVCTGPIVKSGSGYVAPYGWACKPVQVVWEFPELTGMGA